METVKGVFISSTNKYMEDKYKDVKGEVSFSKMGNVSFSNIDKSIFMQTSMIRSFRYIEDTLYLKTLNSVYVFKTEEKLNIVLTDKMKTNFDLLDSENNKPYSKYHCYTKSEKLHTITFDKPITRKEAIYKSNNENLLADNGEEITYICLEVS